MRQVIIYPGNDGFWVAECPSLPGCISQGQSRTEAIANIKEAIEGYELALKDDGLPIPDIDAKSHQRLRPCGLCAGEFSVPDDFDDPLPLSVLADFECE